MSRPISTRQSEMVALDTRAAALLVRVRTYTDREAGTVDETFYFADRAIRYDYGNTGTVREFWPFLLGATPLSVAMNHLPDPGGLARRRELTVRLANVPHEEGGVPLLERLRQTNLEGADVEVATLDLGVGADHFDASALVGSEHVVWLRGRVERVGQVTRESFDLELRSHRPGIPWRVLSDPLTNDPRDLGKRLQHIYGAAKKVPMYGISVGWVTTTAGAISASYTGVLGLTDVSGLPDGALALRLGGEEVAATKAGATVTITARAQNGTKAAEHAQGTAVLEVIASAKYGGPAHACKALQALYVLNPLNGLVTKVDPARYSVNLADTVEGGTASTISISSAQMRALLDDLHRAADAVGGISHASFSSIVGQRPSNGPVTLRNFNLQDGYTDTGSEDLDLTFPAPPGGGVIVSQTVRMVVDAGSGSLGGRFSLRDPDNFDDPVLLLDIGSGGEYGYQTVHQTNTWRLHWSSGHTRTVFEIWRDVEYASADPSLTNVAAIVAAEVGYGLRFFADWDGYAVPAGDTNFSVAEGVLIEHPADVIRHRLAILGGQGHASLDPDWTTTAIANLGAGAKFACVLNELGDSEDEIDARLAFEARSNLVDVERDSGTIWRLLQADSSYAFPAASIAIDRYGEGVTEDGTPGDAIATRFRCLYRRDRTLGYGEEAFQASLRADPDQSDVTTPNATALAAAEAAFGRREHDPWGLLCVDDEATAKDWLGYMAHELSRAPRSHLVPDVPWDLAHVLELGDTRILTPPWSSSALEVRVLSLEKRFDTEMVDVRTLEVG